MIAVRAASNAAVSICWAGVPVTAVTLAKVFHCREMSASLVPSTAHASVNQVRASGQWLPAACPRRRSTLPNRSPLIVSRVVTSSQDTKDLAFSIASICCTRALVPPAAVLELDAERPRRSDGRAAGLSSRLLHRRDVLLDLGVVVVLSECLSGRHHKSPASDCASMASHARRYSPASQSLARCR